MPGFTAIATYLVSAYTGAAVVAGTWAAFSVSLVATGLALVTSRLINGPGGRGGAGGGAENQGVKVQLPPNSTNKIPVVYGTAYQQGIITDARITAASNNTMTYVLTLSEMTDTGSFTINDIYWNDQRMLFGTDGYTVTATEIKSFIDGVSSSTISTAYAGNIQCWTYAGGSSSANQIQGPTPAVDAYTLFDDCVQTSTSSWAMSDLVFGIIKLTYSGVPGKEITGLPTITYDITNSLSNPGEVWVDYMTNSRYGAGFTITEINTSTAIGPDQHSLKNISNQIPANQFEYWPPNSVSTATTASNQVRYEINGVLNTGETVKTNLEKINLASASYTTYDHKMGQWSVVANRATTSTDVIFAFNDDNIIGDINLSTTPLEDLYNTLEVAFADRTQRDQIDYYRDSIPGPSLNVLETPNEMRLRTDLINNNIQAGRIGLMEIYQSRADLVISFVADYSALQVETGDVVSVTNFVLGYTNKLFRVTRVRETEGEDGAIAAEITALEYDANVYTDYYLVDTSVRPTSGVPVYNIPAPSAPVVSSQDPVGTFPRFALQTTIPSGSFPIDSVQALVSTDGVNYSSLNTFVGDGVFDPGDVVTSYIYGLGPNTYYFKARLIVGGIPGTLSAASTAFNWEPTFTEWNFDNGNIIQ
jgi:hypothetical protein